ncbi:MAG TPA: RDD family protein, partial [Chitinophagaceae bacterium]|nr:RDD family protein [Chitinophagaceae bacterium]
MGVIKVPTNFNIDVEFEIPEFYRRLLALLIDIVIEFFYFKIALEIFKSIVENSYSRDIDQQNNLQAVAMLLFLPILIYHIVLEITMNGQSIGKKILGIRVVNENGGRASISQFLIRWLLRVSDVWIVALILVLASTNFGHDL